jgi:hypothetical protein
MNFKAVISNPVTSLLFPEFEVLLFYHIQCVPRALSQVVKGAGA